MDYLPTFGEKWPHSRGNGLVNIPYMDPMGLSCSFYGVCVCVRSIRQRVVIPGTAKGEKGYPSMAFERDWEAPNNGADPGGTPLP